MPAAFTIPNVSKKQAPRSNDKVEKVVIYLEVNPDVKALMEDLAREHNRKLTGECIQALQEYLKKYERWPPA